MTDRTGTDVASSEEAPGQAQVPLVEASPKRENAIARREDALALDPYSPIPPSSADLAPI